VALTLQVKVAHIPVSNGVEVESLTERLHKNPLVTQPHLTN